MTAQPPGVQDALAPIPYRHLGDARSGGSDAQLRRPPRYGSGSEWHTALVKHASEATLERLGPLLRALRAMPALREKRQGTFYRGARAFVHFHEDPTGLYADVRFGDEFDRIDVTTVAKQQRLARRIRSALRPSSEA